MERYIKVHVKRDAIARRLQRIPGIARFGVLLLQAEIGPMARFASAQELSACAGPCAEHAELGRQDASRPHRTRDPWLKWLVIEALQALKLAPGLGGSLQEIAARKGESQSNRRGGAQVLPACVLDAEGGVELHRMASPP